MREQFIPLQRLNIFNRLLSIAIAYSFVELSTDLKTPESKFPIERCKKITKAVE